MRSQVIQLMYFRKKKKKKRHVWQTLGCLLYNSEKEVWGQGGLGRHIWEQWKATLMNSLTIIWEVEGRRVRCQIKFLWDCFSSKHTNPTVLRRPQHLPGMYSHSGNRPTPKEGEQCPLLMPLGKLHLWIQIQTYYKQSKFLAVLFWQQCALLGIFNTSSCQTVQSPAGINWPNRTYCKPPCPQTYVPGCGHGCGLISS